MPEPREAGGAVALGQTIYILGGLGNHKSVIAYDLASNAWRYVTDIPTPRDHVIVVSFNEMVCALGGRPKFTVFECYDPRSDRWETMPALLLGAGDHGGAVIGGHIWVIGRTVQVFDGKEWRPGPEIPNPTVGPRSGSYR